MLAQLLEYSGHPTGAVERIVQSLNELTSSIPASSQPHDLASQSPQATPKKAKPASSPTIIDHMIGGMVETVLSPPVIQKPDSGVQSNKGDELRRQALLLDVQVHEEREELEAMLTAVVEYRSSTDPRWAARPMAFPTQSYS